MAIAPSGQGDARKIADYFERLREEGALDEASVPSSSSIAGYVDAPCSIGCELLWAFDSRFYVAKYPDVAAGGLNPLLHFIEFGWREQRNPSPLIDMRYMVGLQPHLGNKAGSAPLGAFLAESALGPVFSHPLFNPEYYISQLPIPLIGSGLRHFLSGHGDELRPHRLFIPAYYRSQIPQLELSEAPLRHYLLKGWRMGLKPHPDFDTNYYLSTYADVAAAGVEPLTHYVEYGQLEDRNPSYSFQSSAYRKLVGFEKTPRMSPLEHKLTYNA